MKIAIKVALATLLGCGGLLLVLGLVIWTGSGDQLIPVHIALGVVLVLSLWTLTAIAARAGVRTRTAAFAAGWGVLAVVLGLLQEKLLPGSWHWTIQALHVAISMGAIWSGRRLVGLMRQAPSPGPRSSHAPVGSMASP